MTQSRLQKLEADFEALKARLQQERAREQQKARKRDNQKKILAGAMVLHQCSQDPAFEQVFRRHLDRFLTRNDHRALFDFPPLPEPPTETPPINGSGIGTGH